MKTSPWIRGLDGSQAIGGSGRYRALAGDDVIAMHTCVWRGHEITTLSGTPRAMVVPELGDTFQVTVADRDWTGKRVSYRWKGGGLDVDLHTTLPGPLFRARGKSLRLRFPSGAEPGRLENLLGGKDLTFRGGKVTAKDRLWILHTGLGRIILATSAPLREIRIVSHMHWDLIFAQAGGAALIVPLLDEADIPRDATRQKLWLRLAERPPLSTSERFREHGDRLEIEARFPRADLAPVPAFMALLGGQGDLCRGPTATTLCSGWDGPYAVANGSTWRASIAMAWTRTRLVGDREADGDLDPIPEELAYAGDANWEPGTCMDQFLSLRTWAPLLGAAPADLRRRLAKQLAVPTPASLRRGVEIIREPSRGQSWGRLRQMWDHNGDACYDVDWYNGFVLSGLERSVRCADPTIARAAARTAAACRPERNALVDYFTVFHDWALCSAWSDPRGWMWNADCCHNGLEGILGEARLRADEGRTREAAFLRYLCARTAVSLLAAQKLPVWHEGLTATAGMHLDIRTRRMRTWSDASDGGGDLLATQAITSWRDRSWCTTTTRNPYLAAGNFPEWAACLRQHAGADWLAAVRQAWNADSERHRDWLRYYLGDDWEARRAKGDQEARIQAAVFYHLAPEVCFRRFALGEAAPDIEARFQTTLNLAEQLLLRGGFALAEDTPRLAVKAAAR